MIRKVFSFFLALLIFVVLTGCTSNVDMPFNGDITFHNITLTIPDRFIRDSVRSNEDLWIFESQNYTQYILLTRVEIDDQDTDAFLKNYKDSMSEVGTSESVSFQGLTAVQSVYYKDNVPCHEIFFPYRSSFYAIALRGGTEATFSYQLLKSVRLIQPTE